MPSSPPLNHDHLEAASEWFAVLADQPVSQEDLLAWQQWLNEEEAHREAWRQVESVGALFSSFQDEASQQSARYVLGNSSTLTRRQLMKGVFGISSVAALGWVGWHETSLPHMASAWMSDFHTQVGQVANYDLEDGSQVWLNTNSAINRNLSRDHRHVSLMLGEVLIQTQDAVDKRDFFVSCPHGVVNAGVNEARFCVRQLSDDQTVLAVYEGAVTLSLADSKVSKTLHAGEETLFNARFIAEAQPASLLYESWREGLLIVEDMPLKGFMAEIGRYHYGYINLDPSVADLRVVGTFPNHDLGLVLSMLEKSFPIRIKQPLPWWVSISAV